MIDALRIGESANRRIGESANRRRGGKRLGPAPSSCGPPTYRGRYQENSETRTDIFPAIG
ncbi:hypothetical protein KDX16_29070 [Burkholderia vietnamiensis]|uniref:hypothetical protein n=1 Tax=Burkholderia vietnamiensis TaxID=60552 RepID=UPI001BA1D42C|nr:hypothetical protein [Burkholderia vietnamiensis]MBR7919854.1 hypothetical protein [Burkholderia vietnamiensis]